MLRNVIDNVSHSILRTVVVMCDRGHAEAWPLLWRQQVGDSTACSKKAIHVPSRFYLAGAALLLGKALYLLLVYLVGISAK